MLKSRDRTISIGDVLFYVNIPELDLGVGLDGNRLVDVMWDGKTVMRFTTDIRERCVKMEDV